jgi:hypothetical protein
MTVCIGITGKQSSPRLKSEGRIALEEAIEDFLGELGEVGNGGSGSVGWNFEVANVDEDELEETLEKLAGFLRTWGVPTDTKLYVYTPDNPDGEPAVASKYDGRVVRVFPEPT